MTYIFKCEECNGSIVVNADEQYCKRCGLIIEDHPLDTTPDYDYLNKKLIPAEYASFIQHTMPYFYKQTRSLSRSESLKVLNPDSLVSGGGLYRVRRGYWLKG